MILFFPKPRWEAQGLCIFFLKVSLMGVGELPGDWTGEGDGGGGCHKNMIRSVGTEMCLQSRMS